MEYVTGLTGFFTVIIALAAFIYSRVTFRQNQKFIRKQQFESTFFNMMKQLEDIVSKLTLDDKTGRDVFEYFYKVRKTKILDSNFIQKCLDGGLLETGPLPPTPYEVYTGNKENTIYIVNDESNFCIFSHNGVEEIITKFGVRGYELTDKTHMFDHYFRYLYRIVKFINEAEYLENRKKYINARYNYIGILRASLSPFELVLLYYNGLSKKGENKFKPLIEKYTLLKNLRSVLLVRISEDEIDREKTRYMSTLDGGNQYMSYDKSAHFKDNNLNLKNLM